MQTFLPYTTYPAAWEGFRKSAACLDDKRLKNQVKECAQILASLLGGAYLLVGPEDEPVLYSTGGYPKHPATRMWRKHRASLCRYAIACVEEMRSRGSKGMKVYEAMFRRCREIWDDGDNPLWLDDPRLSSSHRAALLAKDPEHYGQFGWTEEPGHAYYWPE